MFRIINDSPNQTTTLSANQWTNWTDEELLLEYRSTGIREAFDEIVRRYERELYNYLYHYLGNAANAEDVSQKTFLAVMKGCDKFDAGREFRSWLYTIATHKAVDHHRKAKRVSAVSIDAYVSEYGVSEEIAGHEPEPFEAPMDREIAFKVREAVDSLPEQMKQAVYMVYFQGLSQREAATATGIHYSALSLRMKHAIKKLNFLLKNVG